MGEARRKRAEARRNGLEPEAPSPPSRARVVQLTVPLDLYNTVAKHVDEHVGRVGARGANIHDFLLRAVEYAIMALDAERQARDAQGNLVQLAAGPRIAL